MKWTRHRAPAAAWVSLDAHKAALNVAIFLPGAPKPVEGQITDAGEDVSCMVVAPALISGRRGSTGGPRLRGAA